MWNAMLNTAFPAAEGYVVKPQAPVRPETSRRSDDSWASKDSYNRVVSDEKPLLPDFIVARCVGPRNHIALLLVEIKRRDFDVGTSSELATHYIDAIGVDDSVRGMAWIVVGNSTAYCYQARVPPLPGGTLGAVGECDGPSVEAFMLSLKGPQPTPAPSDYR